MASNETCEICHACPCMRRRLHELAAERDRLRDALEGVVWQFGHRTTKDGAPVLTSGGYSDLEHALSVLGWPDPYSVADVPEVLCQAPGCTEWNTCGTPTPDGYKRLCSQHYAALTRDREHGK